MSQEKCHFQSCTCVTVTARSDPILDCTCGYSTCAVHVSTSTHNIQRLYLRLSVDVCTHPSPHPYSRPSVMTPTFLILTVTTHHYTSGTISTPSITHKTAIANMLIGPYISRIRTRKVVRHHLFRLRSARHACGSSVAPRIAR
jgi:hypothetical protein